MAEGFRIATAYVDVKANADGLRAEVTRDVKEAGAGQDIRINVKVETKQATDDLNKLSVTGGRVFSPLIASAIAAGTIIGGPLALGAIPIIFGGVAAAILSKNEQIRASFSTLGHNIVNDLRDDTQVLVPYFQGISTKIGTSFQELRPQLRGIFADLGPELTTLTDGILKFTSNAMPGFVAAIHSGQPVVEGLSDLLAKMGTGLSGLFTELSKGSAASGQLLSQLGTGIQALLPFLGQLLTFATQLGTGALPVFGSSIGSVMSLISSLIGVLGPVAPLLGQITGYVLSAVGAFKLFGSLGGGLERLGAGLSNVALNAGVMTERLTGSANAGEKVAVAGSKVSGALTKLGAALPLAGVALVGLGLAWDALVVSTDDATAALAKGGKAAQDMTASLANQTTVAAALTATNMPLLQGIASLVPTLGSAKAALDQQRSTMTEVQRLTSLAAQAQGDYELAVQKFGASSPQAVAAQQNLAAATDRVKQAQYDAAQATQSHTDRIIEQTNILAGAANADVAYQQSLLAVKDAQKQADDASRQYGATSQQTQSAVLNLEQQVLSAAAAAQRKAEADTASLGPQAQARAGSDAYATTLINLAAAATGPARSALLGYVQNLDSSQLAAISATNATSGFRTEVITLPNGKTVTIIANTGQALAAISGVQGALAGLRDRYVNVVVRTVQDIASGIPHAQGGVFRPMASGGVVKAAGYAGGGMRRMSATRPALVPPGDLRVIGDNQRYTELFAPLDGTKRSLSYIRYGANAFGFDLVPMASASGAAPRVPDLGSGLAEALRKFAARMANVTVNVMQASGSPAETGRFVALALRTVG